MSAPDIVNVESDSQAARRHEERDDPDFALIRSHEEFEAEEDDYELDDGS